MTSHRSSAYVKAIGDRGRAWKPDPITNQFRFVVRMTYACHERNVPYDLTWDRHESVMRATVTVDAQLIDKAFTSPRHKQQVHLVKVRSLGETREQFS